MAHTNLFLKVEVEHEDGDKPEQLGAAICRQILKIYGVRSAELSSFTALEQ